MLSSVYVATGFVCDLKAVPGCEQRYKQFCKMSHRFCELHLRNAVLCLLFWKKDGMCPEMCQSNSEKLDNKYFGHYKATVFYKQLKDGYFH